MIYFRIWLLIELELMYEKLSTIEKIDSVRNSWSSFEKTYSNIKLIIICINNIIKNNIILIIYVIYTKWIKQLWWKIKNRKEDWWRCGWSVTCSLIELSLLLGQVLVMVWLQNIYSEESEK